MKKSTRPEKKFMVIINKDGKHKTIHFGAKNMSDFTIHKDVKRRENYIKRHRKNENFDDYMTAGFYAKNILWNKETIQESIRDTNNKYGLNIKYV